MTTPPAPSRSRAGGVTAAGGAPAGRQRSAGNDPRLALLPVARVTVDSGLAHLDRTFDYAVPAELDAAAPGCRVRVRFAGRLVDGIVLARTADSDHPGELAPIAALVSPLPVLPPEIAALCRAVADRMAGSLWDVVRLAVPPRHARVEAEPPGPDAGARPPAPEVGSWQRYPTASSFLRALAAGRSPRAVWTALPGGSWPEEVAGAVRACVAGGRAALVVVPDLRDAAQVSAALGDLEHVQLRADLGPAKRYRAFLRVLRAEVRVVIGTRAAAFAPLRDLGLLVLWDDGDDLHAEPRAPYPHVREVLIERSRQAGAALLIGGHARTAEAQLLLDNGWAQPLQAPRDVVRAVAPRVAGTSEDDLARDPLAQAARLPAAAFQAARAALAADAPVLVQVPRRGYLPSLACRRDATRARCPRCSGPLGMRGSTAVPGCGWCGQLATDWRCPTCDGTALRALVVGSRRTAEELGRAFPLVALRTSGRHEVLATVPARPALVVCTPGAEPVATGGYGAVLLLDGWAALGRPDLRATEEALRRWFNAAALARPAADGGRVVVVADQGLAPVQALTRWDPAGAARRELGDRALLGFPPATRMAALDGSAAALADVLPGLQREGLEVLGPVPWGEGERLLLRVPLARGADLAAAVRSVVAGRAARKAEPVRAELDPQELV